ncbi:epoxide hydrolase family protein [Mycobacteroides salmoniphilum]|uniref:epoxide hydrolase family protein n=1 Tax=Mycobacteroides salmoniphilum TaxID=404941 RepID=UPI0012FF997A|nr:epoxide hydrolase family protein [Mycobacteroides salmoniphilum]
MLIPAQRQTTVAPRLLNLDVPEAEVDDLRERLASTRWPALRTADQWDHGINIEWLQQFCDYWRLHYNWYEHQQKLNAGEHFVIDVDGYRIHYQHVRASTDHAMPLLLTHGWPSAYHEMHRLIGPLTDPASHGAPSEQAFDVVIPSLPGFGFSAIPDARCSPADVANLWAKLMERLGYDTFGAHGGDFGAAVTNTLAFLHPDRLTGIHMTAAAAAAPTDRALSDEESSWAETFTQWREREWGYLHLQRTKPNTPATALNDSPAGLAAWILEKWWQWSDKRTSTTSEGPITFEDLATIASIYWFTGTIGPSMQMYRNTFGPNQSPSIWLPNGVYFDVPTAILACHEPIVPPESLVKNHYDLRSYRHLGHGGHFPAIENPHALARDLRAFYGRLPQ